MSHAAAAQLDWFWRFAGGIIMSEWIKFRERGWLKVVMKILKGEFAVCSAGKRALLFQRRTKNTIYQSRPPSSLGQQRKPSKKNKKNNVQKVLQHVCAPFIYHWSHLFPNKELYSFPARVVEVKTTAWGILLLQLLLQENKQNTTKPHRQNQIGNTLARQNASYYVSKWITQLANQMWFPQ